ncbi:MAG: hypothetical protein P8R43_00960, partial [Planctomycetota bacterium]|nr:hypothetical protein [Planctomycetota bacterium]
MADSQPQGDKARKPRPFGSFLLFLTVIVVVLVAFSGSSLRKAEELTQDGFLHALVTGTVQRLELKGQTDVEGVLTSGKTFETSFASVAEHEEYWRDVKARARYTSEQPETLLKALADGTFQPTEVWQVTEVSVESTRAPEADETPEPPRTRQTDRLYVFGVATPGSGFTPTGGTVGQGTNGEEGDYEIALKIGNVAPRLTEVREALVAKGAALKPWSFDLTPNGGTVHGPPDGSFTLMLLTYGPWLLIFAIFILF